MSAQQSHTNRRFKISTLTHKLGSLRNRLAGSNSSQAAISETSSINQSPNHSYYFETGIGYWIGTFDFEVSDWNAFWSDSISLVDRFLVLSMAIVMGLVRNARITSYLEGFPKEQPAGVVTNEVRITKFGVTLYLLHERYILHPDGHGVTVASKERFGPLPFLLTRTKVHPAEVMDGGTKATYYMPLLGTDWIGHYQVRPDHNHIESVLECRWGKAREIIDRVR